jgi:hypothetical protein
MVYVTKMLYPHVVTETYFSYVPVHTNPYSGGSTNLLGCFITMALKMKANKKMKKKNYWFLNISSA